MSGNCCVELVQLVVPELVLCVVGAWIGTVQNDGVADGATEWNCCRSVGRGSSLVVW